jgi:hypothetical protein
MGLQWIRFKNGKEKEVNEKLAFDPNLQKVQQFVVIDAPSGNAVSAPILNAEKKSVPPVTSEPKAVDYKKEFLKANLEGKAFAEIAKPSGLHWKQVEKIIGEAKADVNNAIEGGKAADVVATEYNLTIEQVAEIVNKKAQ